MPDFLVLSAFCLGFGLVVLYLGFYELFIDVVLEFVVVCRLEGCL